MPYIDTSDGARIHYHDEGSGRPLVLIHGWGGSGAIWGLQMELSASCRLIIPDLRGHGRSTAPGSPLLLDDLAGDVVALFTHLDLKDALLLGWSLGSQVAIASFHLLRERLAGLILVGAPPRFTACEDYPHGLPAEDLRGMGLRLRRNFERTMGEFFRGMFVPGELSAQQEARIASAVLAPGILPDPGAALSTLAILGSSDLRSELAAIDLPVLVIHGKEDGICPLGAAGFIVEKLPHARLLELEGVGHAPGLSRPELFNKIIKEYLQETPHG